MNARGLDLRLRAPEGRDRLEAEARRRAGAKLARGAVTASLSLEGEAGRAEARLDPEALRAAVEAAVVARAAAERASLAVAPTSATELLTLRGVFEAAPRRPAEAEDEASLDDALLAGFERALDALVESRRVEGAALVAAALMALEEIESRLVEAEAALGAQREAAPARLREKVAALLDAGAEVEPNRLAQELALLLVKEDVREEIDRLGAHLAAARALLSTDGAVGRRLDFLTQEFNREANTLCAKSASAALTAAGLEIKVAVDRLREQAANLE